MEYKTITFNDGTKVVPMGMGTWYMGENPALRHDEVRALRWGMDAGLTVIDTAEMYGDGRAEQVVAEAIAGRRDEVYLIDKVLPWHAGRDGVKQVCEGSLKRLKTDFIDLYLLHWRGPYPLAETVEAMEQLREEGKIGLWGVSNLDTDDMEELFSTSTSGCHCAANEVLYNLSRRGIEYDLLPWCKDKNMPVIAYSPIEQGRILHNSTLHHIARKYNVAPATVALAWLLTHTGVLPIPKAGTEEHARQNFAALSLRLDDEDLRLLNEAFPAPEGKTPLEMI